MEGARVTLVEVITGLGSKPVIPSAVVPRHAEQTRPYRRRSFVRWGAPPFTGRAWRAPAE